MKEPNNKSDLIMQQIFSNACNLAATCLYRYTLSKKRQTIERMEEVLKRETSNLVADVRKLIHEIQHFDGEMPCDQNLALAFNLLETVLAICDSHEYMKMRLALSDILEQAQHATK